MIRRLTILMLLWALLAPHGVSAQPWSGILDPTRAIDWSTAGVTGGPATRTTICSTVAAYTGTAATINTALQGCPSGQVVSLGAGTFTLSTGITFQNGSTALQNITIRGAGPDQTTLVFTGDTGCTGLHTLICVADVSGVYNNGVGSHVVNWTAGYTQGTTAITVSDASSLAVGMYIFLDQLNDADAVASTYARFITVNSPWNTSAIVSGRGTTAATNRAILQRVKITAINGTTLTISPGVAYPGITAGQTPQVWWAGTVAQTPVGIGIENLTVNNQTGNTALQGNIQFFNASESWVKNVRSLNSGVSHILIDESSKIEVRDSYFYGENHAPGGGTQYTIEMLMASHSKIENNIMQQTTAPIKAGGSIGCVAGYNFAIDTLWVGTDMQQAIFPTHEAGASMFLLEGNDLNGTLHDLSHGSTAVETHFRNRYTGTQSGKTTHTVPAILQGFNRFNNFVGNVLGTFGYHTNYESSTGPQGVTGSFTTSIYSIGYTASGESDSGAGYDSTAITSLLRWGNYDYATGTIRWNASEIPTDNAVPGNHVLPASFYLAAQPAWWGTMPFPPIGPDVTGGTDVSGHAYNIPAKTCYLTTMGGPADGTGGVLIFNANACYNPTPPGPTGIQTPGAPSRLTISRRRL
jgi:hypothetical protein